VSDSEDLDPREYLRRFLAALLRSRVIYSVLAAVIGAGFGIVAGMGAELMAPGAGVSGFAAVTAIAIAVSIVAGSPSPHGRHGERR
jgi:hypothetical protein